MGALCSRLKVRVNSRRPKYATLRTESPSGDNLNGSISLQEPQPPPWSEAREKYDKDQSSSSDADLEQREKTLAESSFNKIASQIVQLNKPVNILRSAITNSLLLFRMALGLTKDATMSACFEVLKDADPSMSIELINTSDGPHKLSLAHSSWSQLSDNIQSAIKHFNSIISSCHKFLGNQELKLVDIQLKLEDIQLLPLTKERELELNKLKVIPVQIEEFTREIETLFESVGEAGKLLEYSPNDSMVWS